MEPVTAMRNDRLVVNPMVNTDLLDDRQLKALNMSKNTKQVNVIVVSRGVTTLSLNWKRESKAKENGCEKCRNSRQKKHLMKQ